MTITKNLCFDRLKSKQAQNLRVVYNDYQNQRLDLQEQIELRDSLNWVAKIIDDLPKQQRTVVQLRDIECYTFDEIAAVLDMKPSAIRANLSRARKTIRKQLTNTHHYGI